jgi:glycosyltransferase involved in cell wall biosynthesis
MAIRSIHVIGTEILGGAERFLARLANALHADGFPSLALVRPRSPLPELLDAEVPVEQVGMRNGVDLLSIIQIRRLVARLEPQVIQSYMGRATRLTRLPPSGATVHVARLGGYYRMASYRHADALVGNTQGICDYLVRNGFPRDRVFKIGNFVGSPAAAEEGRQVADVRRELEVPEDAAIIFALGRFVAKKGFGGLLDAFARLPETHRGRRLILVIAGAGPLGTELRERAASLGVGDRIRWPGWVLHPGDFYASADVFVCPSLEEPLGNVILEAWSWAVTVVSTETAGPAELITSGKDGVLVGVADPQGLADGIWRVLDSEPAVRDGLLAAGRATLQREHSEEAVVAAYRDLYGRLSRRR